MVDGSGLKCQGNKSRRKRDNGPQDMELDHMGKVAASLSSKAWQHKDDSTQVEPQVEQATSAQTLESNVRNLDPSTGVSGISHASSKENFGKLQNMRKE